MRLQQKPSLHSLDGLFVRNATLGPKDASGVAMVELRLSPSDDRERNLLSHWGVLDATDEVTVQIPSTLVEALVPPDQMGSLDHKVAQLHQSCINLKMSFSPEEGIQVVDGTNDPTYVIYGDDKTGFRPTPKIGRLILEDVSAKAGSFVSSHIRNYFQPTKGFLVPQETGRGLSEKQRDMVRILSPYAKAFCDTADKCEIKGHASFDGHFLSLMDKRLGSFQEVVEAENTFGKEPADSPVHGKVTLSDVLGSPADSSWAEASGRRLNNTLSRSERLDYTISNLGKQIPKLSALGLQASLEARLGRKLTDEQKAEVTSQFNLFMEDIVAQSRQRLAPLNDFCEKLGHKGTTPTQEQSLAILNHVARYTEGVPSTTPPKEYKLSDGTKLDFTADLMRLVADHRNFGEKLPNAKTVQQAANAALLFHISRETMHAYWEVGSPTPCYASIESLMKETQHKVNDRFTKRPHPIANPGDIFEKFQGARNLIQEQMEAFLGTPTEKKLLVPPKTLTSRLMEKSPGIAEVTRSRGIILRSACAIFHDQKIPDEKVDGLLRDTAQVTGRSLPWYVDEVNYVSKAFSMTRAEAAAILVMHEAVQNPDKNAGAAIANKLDQFGKDNVKDFAQSLETALDSGVRAQSLTADKLSRMLGDSPEELVKALDPEAKSAGQLANLKSAAVANAGLLVLKNDIRSELEWYKDSLRSSMSYRNIEGAVFTGAQAAKILNEVIDERFEEEIDATLAIMSIPDAERREHKMNARAALLAEHAQKTHDAVEVEADARCYPGGRSPRRVSEDLMKRGVHNLAMAKGIQLDDKVFAPPDF